MNSHSNPEMKTYIPFSQPSITEKEIDEVVDTLRNGWITLGPKTKQFEKDFQAFIGCRHAIAVSSCTAGLHLSLVAAEIGPGDEVLTTPYTFASTSHVILHVGARPVFVDIDPETLNMDVKNIRGKITPRTKAIIPVHIAGYPCEMNEILEIARENNLSVFEDAAHALPTQYHGTLIGNFGDTTSFSFYATKNITTGEGGMITTNDDELAEKLRLLSLHGISKDAWKRYTAEGSWMYDVIYPGYKYNMSDIQAAMGLWQLKRIDEMQQRREEIVRAYNQAFEPMPEIDIPVSSPDFVSAQHLYVIRLVLNRLNINRDQFIQELTAEKIGTSVHFIPHHLHSFYQKKLGFAAGDFPAAETAFKRVISLPLYPNMSDANVSRVIEAVRTIAHRHRIG